MFQIKRHIYLRMKYRSENTWLKVFENIESENYAWLYPYTDYKLCITTNHCNYTSTSKVSSLVKSLDICKRSLATILVNCLKIASSFGIMRSRITLQSTKSKPFVVQKDVVNLRISSIQAFIRANCFC